MRKLMMAVLAIAIPISAAGAETEYWVPWNFHGEACRRSSETPEQFIARRSAGLPESVAAKMNAVRMVAPDGSLYIEVRDRGETFKFWMNIDDCRTDHYRNDAKPDPYR